MPPTTIHRKNKLSVSISVPNAEINPSKKVLVLDMCHTCVLDIFLGGEEKGGRILH